MGKSKTNRRGGNRAGGAKDRNKSAAQKGTFKKVFVWIMIILAVLLVAVAAIGIAFVATDGFGGRVNTLTIEINGKSYSDNADGFIFNTGTKIRIKSLTGSPYEYRIEASDKADFEFSVAGESGYHWKYLAGRDMTEYFTIEKTDNGFIVTTESIYDLLKKIYGNDVICDEDVEPGDLFVLIVSCGGRERRFGFYPDPGQRPTGIVIDSSEIIFGGNPPAVKEDPPIENPPKGDEGDEPAKDPEPVTYKISSYVQSSLLPGLGLVPPQIKLTKTEARPGELVEVYLYPNSSNHWYLSTGGVRLTNKGSNLYEFVMPKYDVVIKYLFDLDGNSSTNPVDPDPPIIEF